MSHYSRNFIEAIKLLFTPTYWAFFIGYLLVFTLQ